MCMSASLLKLCEDFCEEISVSEMERNHDLAETTDELLAFLSEQVEHDDDGLDVVEETRDRLTEVWSLISPEEKAANPQLSSHLDELVEHLEYLLEEVIPVDASDDGYPSEFDDYDGDAEDGLYAD